MTSGEVGSGSVRDLIQIGVCVMIKIIALFILVMLGIGVGHAVNLYHYDNCMMKNKGLPIGSTQSFEKCWGK